MLGGPGSLQATHPESVTETAAASSRPKRPRLTIPIGPSGLEVGERGRGRTVARDHGVFDKGECGSDQFEGLLC